MSQAKKVKAAVLKKAAILNSQFIDELMSDEENRGRDMQRASPGGGRHFVANNGLRNKNNEKGRWSSVSMNNGKLKVSALEAKRKVRNEPTESEFPGSKRSSRSPSNTNPKRTLRKSQSISPPRSRLRDSSLEEDATRVSRGSKNPERNAKNSRRLSRSARSRSRDSSLEEDADRISRGPKNPERNAKKSRRLSRSARSRLRDSSLGEAADRVSHSSESPERNAKNSHRVSGSVSRDSSLGEAADSASRGSKDLGRNSHRLSRSARSRSRDSSLELAADSVLHSSKKPKRNAKNSHRVSGSARSRSRDSSLERDADRFSRGPKNPERNAKKSRRLSQSARSRLRDSSLGEAADRVSHSSKSPERNAKNSHQLSGSARTPSRDSSLEAADRVSHSSESPERNAKNSHQLSGLARTPSWDSSLEDDAERFSRSSFRPARSVRSRSRDSSHEEDDARDQRRSQELEELQNPRRSPDGNGAKIGSRNHQRNMFAAVQPEIVSPLDSSESETEDVDERSLMDCASCLWKVKFMRLKRQHKRQTRKLKSSSVQRYRLTNSLTAKCFNEPITFTSQEGFPTVEQIKAMDNITAEKDYAFVRLLMRDLWPNGFGNLTVTGNPTTNCKGRAAGSTSSKSFTTRVVDGALDPKKVRFVKDRLAERIIMQGNDITTAVQLVYTLCNRWMSQIICAYNKKGCWSPKLTY